MPNRATTLFHIAAAAAALSLAGCDSANKDAELASLDNQILENGTDPALTSALEDQILVDPTLTQQSNKNAVRPAETPTRAQYPKPAGGAAANGEARTAAARPGAVQRSGSTAVQAASADLGQVAGCEAELNRNLQWAKRLPPAFAVFPGSRLTEAAGSDSANCRARVVTFTSNAPPQRVLEYYRGRATQAGYSADHQMRQGDHILAGVGARDGGAFYLIVTPLGSGGSDVALIANRGA
jgi:hypothetical protein